MSIVDVRIDQMYLDKAYKALRAIPGAFPKAVSMAVNRTVEHMRTDAVSETEKRYFTKANEIRKTMTLKKASATNMNAIMLSRGGRKKLSDYKLTPKTPLAGRKTGFKGAVKREGGLKPLPKGTFMMNTPNAGPVLFLRVSPGRAWRNIKHVHSPSIPQIMKNKETAEIVEERAIETFKKRLDHEVLRILGALP